jgi:hypothetical protein
LALDEDDHAAIRDLEADFGSVRHSNPHFNVNNFVHPDLFAAERRPFELNNRSSESRPLPPMLPPWGLMDDPSQVGIGEHIPLDWYETDWASPNDFPSRDRSVWRTWVAEIVKDISDNLWPTYDPQSPNRWQTLQVKDLLEADFTVFSVLSEIFNLPISGRYPTQVLHSAAFAEEDTAIPLGSNYKVYDPNHSDRFYEELPGILAAGIGNKLGTLSLQLKQAFQRPRAYQVAFLQNRAFSWHWASTASTPSLVSGHCMQGIIGGCAAWVALNDAIKSVQGTREIFEQFVIDIGDRRVFAGVHYPSDNLASWYVAMKLIPRVFLSTEKGLEPHKFLWRAIQRSLVYKAIVEHTGPGTSPYAAMLEKIELLARESG